MTDNEYNPMRYIVAAGSVRPLIVRHGDRTTPMFMEYFGRAEYDREKPILSESLRTQGQTICDDLNSGAIDEEEARRRLARIYF